MEFLSDILGVGAVAASGGLFGFLGAIGGQVSKYFQEKQRQSWEREKWSHEERLLKLQMEARSQETELELAIVAQQGSWQGLSASIKGDVGQPSYKWVAAVKSCFRPFITIVLWVLSAWVFAQVFNSDGIFSKSESKDLIAYMVYSVFFTACTATAWWFGDRALTPPGLKNK